MTTPRVSVIIPVYNDNERLKLCLDALNNQTLSTEEFEVIVVDNGSDNPPVALIESYPHVSLVHESEPGSYVARNTGLKYATAPIIAFTDSDCIPQSDWVEIGIGQINQYAHGCIIGGLTEIFYADTNNPGAVELFEALYAFPTDRNIRQKHYAPTCNLFTTRDVIEHVGGFDTSMKSGGDVQFGQTAHGKGIPLYYAGNLIVKHPARRNFSEFAKKIRRVAGGQIDRARQSDKPVFLNYSVYYDFFPPVTALRQLASNTQLTLSQKLKILFVLLWMRTVAIREKIAILAGFKKASR